jgi:hypothetical protein
LNAISIQQAPEMQGLNMTASAHVFVWLPHKTVENTLGIGHSAVQISTAEGSSYYITWLNGKVGGCGISGVQGGVKQQGTEASKRVGFATIRDKKGKEVPNPDAVGSPTTIDFTRDCQANAFRFPELREREVPPNYAFDIPVSVVPARNADDNLFGVSVHRMERFWKHVLMLPPGHPNRRYAALSTRLNCNGVVVDALLVGGLGMFAKPPSNCIYQDARTLVEWVEKATGRIKEMNKQHAEIMQVVGGSNDPIRFADRTIPTYEQWKKDSDKGIAFYARRKEQIEQIDMYIRLYHRALRENNKRMQADFLFLMQMEIYSHLTRKPKSDRRQAVLNLAKRVHAAMQDLFLEHDRAVDDGIHFDRNPGSDVLEIF